MSDLDRLRQIDLPFARLLGIEFLTAAKDRVTAAMLVRPDLCTVNSMIHGGAIMAFADTLGAAGTVLNLPTGAGTTTIESKTNFLAAAPADQKVLGEATPVHIGRRTMVWQTRITLENGRAVALVTQTQMVLEPKGHGV
jgi:uncharacterized protein (TIGR00369 family)